MHGRMNAAVSNMSEMTSQNEAVPARAAEWIGNVLRDAGVPASGSLLLAMEDHSDLDLRLLNVKQLKIISNELSIRNARFHDSVPSIQLQSLMFSPPKSGAKKAEWVSAIGAFFHAHASNKIFFNVLSGTSVALSSTASEMRSPLTKACAKITVAEKSPSASTIRANVASGIKIAPVKLIKKSPPDAKASRINGQSTTNSNPTGKISINGLVNHNSDESAGPKYQPAKVKLEPLSHISTSQSTKSYANASVAAPSAGNDDYSLVPRDFRESNMLAILRDMGFTCTREILTALRAVAANREEIYMVYATNGVDTGWSVQEHVDAAMMWIVTQREEALEASKLDEARISSEQANRAMEQSRTQEMARVLKEADAVDLIGLARDDIEIKSIHFPCSTLLQNRSVKRCFLKLINGDGDGDGNNISGKEEVIRLLNLEKKARKWYGTVLPFSYFEYILCPRIEGWVGGNTAQLCQMLRHESDELEKAMFNLSEQVEGGVGSVPKVFLTAQRDASRIGKPIDAEETRINHYEDVELLEQPLPSISGRARAISRQPVEVIDIT